MKASGISDGSTLQVMSKFRGGGKRKEKMSKAEKKQVTGQESVSGMGPATSDRKKDNVIQLMEEDDAHWKMVAYLSEGNDAEVEQKMQCCMTTFQERSWTSSSVE